MGDLGRLHDPGGWSHTCSTPSGQPRPSPAPSDQTPTEPGVDYEAGLDSALGAALGAQAGPPEGPVPWSEAEEHVGCSSYASNPTLRTLSFRLELPVPQSNVHR